MANFGGSVNITPRLQGQDQALKDLGVNLDEDRAGQKTVKAPKIKTQPQHQYTTSGALLNPKVAFVETTAPNYAKAGLKKQSCLNCKAFDKKDSLMGHCNKYDFYARHDYTCDGWKQK